MQGTRCTTVAFCISSVAFCIICSVALTLSIALLCTPSIIEGQGTYQIQEKILAAAVASSMENMTRDAVNPARPPPPLQSVHLSEFSYVHWPAPCKDRDPRPLLLGAVISAPSNATRRRLLRRLYMSLAEHRGFRLRWVFILGSVPDAKLQAVVDKEAAVFGDIVQLSFRDSYENLTLKTLTAIDWTAAACPGAQFFFKTDEDCMVNPFRLVDFLWSLKLSEVDGLYAGYVPHWLKPSRDSGEKKWRVSRDNYPLVKFPRYAGGPGYLLSLAALARVLGTSQATFPMRLEDVYLGMCATRAGLTPVHLPRLFLMGLYNYSDWCEYRHGVLVHQANSIDMVRMWHHMTAPAGHNPACFRTQRLSAAKNTARTAQ